MEGGASISPEILASYAADAAREVRGVHGLFESRLPRHHGVRVTSADGDGRARVELHLVLSWGASAPEVGRAVQQRVGEYLERMTGARPEAVDVVIDEIGPPS